jgi:hypothetical protein
VIANVLITAPGPYTVVGMGDTNTALLIKHGPTPKQQRGKDAAQDDGILSQNWTSFLYSHLLQKKALNQGLYADAKKSHVIGHCKCGCTRSFALKVRKKK